MSHFENVASQSDSIIIAQDSIKQATVSAVLGSWRSRETYIK